MRINKTAGGTDFHRRRRPPVRQRSAPAPNNRRRHRPQRRGAFVRSTRSVGGWPMAQGGWRPRAKASIHMPSAEDRRPRRTRLSFGYFSLLRQRKVTYKGDKGAKPHNKPTFTGKNFAETKSFRTFVPRRDSITVESCPRSSATSGRKENQLFFDLLHFIRHPLISQCTWS